MKYKLIVIDLLVSNGEVYFYSSGAVDPYFVVKYSSVVMCGRLDLLHIGGKRTGFSLVLLKFPHGI